MPNAIKQVPGSQALKKPTRFARMMNLTTYKDVSLAPQDTIQAQLWRYTIQSQHCCEVIRLHQN